LYQTIENTNTQNSNLRLG